MVTLAVHNQRMAETARPSVSPSPTPPYGVPPESRLEPMADAECLRLLGSHHLGRLAVVVDGRPLIFPVNYAMSGRHVVFRSGAGTKVHAAVDRAVAFEIDGLDGLYHTGWSVLVVGTAYEERDPAHLEELARLPFTTWVSGEKAHWLRIAGGAITGRRIVRSGGRD
jgi:nitroimidazol reductase NimA-like FMN-containing flavoprotein (pyridoxamine 5'-phosphate oxidase superfamily)